MRILFLAANPLESSPLRLGAELREIDEKLQQSAQRDKFELASAFAARPADLLMQMNKVRPHILHLRSKSATRWHNDVR